jgi:hypothetical protein
MKFHQGMFTEKHLLTAFPLAFDELHDAAAKAMANAAGEHAKGGGTLTLAVTCQDQQQAFVYCRRGDIAIDILFFALHGTLMARVAFGGCIGLGNLVHTRAPLIL